MIGLALVAWPQFGVCEQRLGMSGVRSDVKVQSFRVSAWRHAVSSGRRCQMQAACLLGARLLPILLRAFSIVDKP
jgi:hypothetical protein